MTTTNTPPWLAGPGGSVQDLAHDMQLSKPGTQQWIDRFEAITSLAVPVEQGAQIISPQLRERLLEAKRFKDAGMSRNNAIQQVFADVVSDATPPPTPRNTPTHDDIVRLLERWNVRTVDLLRRGEDLAGEVTAARDDLRELLTQRHEWDEELHNNVAQLGEGVRTAASGAVLANKAILNVHNQLDRLDTSVGAATSLLHDVEGIATGIRGAREAQEQADRRYVTLYGMLTRVARQVTPLTSGLPWWRRAGVWLVFEVRRQWLSVALVLAALLIGAHGSPHPS